MITFKQHSNLAAFSMLFMLTLFAAGCGSSGDSAAVTADTTAPTIVSTSPADLATGVYRNRSITALTNEALDASTVNATTFTLTDGTTTVDGNVSYADKTMLFNPTDDLNDTLKYTATITTGVKDSAGNALEANYVWSFTTGTGADGTAPAVTSTDPLDGATGVPLNRSVSALFTEALDPTTVSTTTFTLKNGTTAVDGTVSHEDNTSIFNPKSDLAKNTLYTVTITTGATDLAGNPLAVAKTWSFTTGDAATPELAPVNLGTAGNYVILAETTVTTTGTTAITGNIAVSPNATSFITGFDLIGAGTYATSALVTGRIYAADMTSPTPSILTTAVNDMHTAYTDAAGRTSIDSTLNLSGGNIGGQTLTPGLYKWGTGVSISDAGVIISGSATDVWIFQVAGDLTLASNAQVNLQGGALAKNIFWQVAGGSGVTLGTGAQFKGVVLAKTKIVLNSGATVKGRLLAQTAVTLIANTITNP